MNKARLTYRIDPEEAAKRTGPKASERLHKIIPLYEEEFQVVPDPEKSELRPAGTEPGERNDRVRREESPFTPWRDPQAFAPMANDFGAWETPIESEVQRVERAIRETDNRRRPPAVLDEERQAPQTPELEDPFESPRGRYEPSEYRPSFSGPELTYTTHTRTPNTPWMKLSASIAGAALTGVVLGFFVLHMFSGEAKQDGADTTNPIADIVGGTDVKPAATAAGTKTPDKPVAAAAQNGQASGAAIGLPAKTYTMLQSGSFGTEQAANNQVAELTKKGYAAVVEPADKFNVYVAVAQNRDNALGLGAQLQQQKFEIYNKPYTIPAVGAVKWNGKTDSLKSYLTESDKLIGMISTLSLLHLEDAKPTPLDDPTMQSLKTAHETWSAASTAAAEGMPEEGKAAQQKLNNAINTAKKSLDEYKKNPSTAMLWNAQSSLLKGILAEKELLAALAAQ